MTSRSGCLGGQSSSARRGGWEFSYSIAGWPWRRSFGGLRPQVLNTLKQEFLLRCSRIHFEVRFSHFGCRPDSAPAGCINHSRYPTHCVENATACCFLHSGALIRIGSFGLIRIIWPGSVKPPPQFEEQA